MQQLLNAINYKSSQYVCRLITKHSMNVNVILPNAWGDTPLTLACRLNKRGLVKRLLTMGADHSIVTTGGDVANGEVPTAGGFTALEVAFSVAHNELIIQDLLMAGANPNQVFENQSPLLSYVVSSYSPQISIIHLLCKFGARVSGTDHISPLVTLAYCISKYNAFKSFADTFECLLMNGAQANDTDEDGWTALHHLANSRTTLKIVKNDEDIDDEEDESYHTVDVEDEFKMAIIHLLKAGASPKLLTTEEITDESVTHMTAAQLADSHQIPAITGLLHRAEELYDDPHLPKTPDVLRDLAWDNPDCINLLRRAVDKSRHPENELISRYLTLKEFSMFSKAVNIHGRIHQENLTSDSNRINYEPNHLLHFVQARQRQIELEKAKSKREKTEAHNDASDEPKKKKVRPNFS